MKRAAQVVLLVGAFWINGPWEGIRAGWHLGEWVVEWIMNDTP